MGGERSTAVTCPKCGKEMIAQVVFDRYDGQLNMLVCPDSCYCEPIPQPSLKEAYEQREQLRVAMGRIW